MKICIPLVSKNKNEFLKDIQLLEKEPYDWIEWRIDCMESMDDIFFIAKNIRSFFSCPILGTIRTEGNINCKLDYIGVYKQLILLNCLDWIDVEIESKFEDLIDFAHKHDVQVIGSYHNFHRGLNREQILNLYKNMKKNKVDMYKFASFPSSTKEVVDQLLTTYELYSQEQEKFISICMGETGMVSRLIGGLFGSYSTFACSNKKSAPGQIPATLLKAAIDILHL